MTKTAIVTGASRGIGRAIAVGLGELGWRVAINYHRNAEAAEEAAQLVRDAGGEGLIVQADVGSTDDRQRLLDATCNAFGPVRLLVNNAGVAPRVRADLLEAGEESFDQVLGTNLKGPYFLTQLIARHMIEQREALNRDDGADDSADHVSIVNVGSISAYTASINRGDYCVAKAGMAMMTKLFAVRLAEHGIGVYEIRPGVIATDMTSGVKEKYDKLILEEGLTPIRRWGKPSDIAAAVKAVAQGRLPFSTGEVINVDGGFHLHWL